jgi:hypothetical protein
MNKFELLKSMYKTECKTYLDLYEKSLFEVMTVFYPTGEVKNIIAGKIEKLSFKELKEAVLIFEKKRINEIKTFPNDN